MLDARVIIEGDKIIIKGLTKLADAMPRVANRGMTRIAKGVEREAFDWLSGIGNIMASKKLYAYTRLKDKKKFGERVRTFKVGEADSGGYPVPVRTGHLRQMLDWLSPGTSKTGDAGTFTAGPNEVVVYDSALYANTIHESRGSSAKFSRRAFLTDALEKFNNGDRVNKIFNDEIQKEIEKGL